MQHAEILGCFQLPSTAFVQLHEIPGIFSDSYWEGQGMPESLKPNSSK